jgi:hypothetical protein
MYFFDCFYELLANSTILSETLSTAVILMLKTDREL